VLVNPHYRAVDHLRLAAMSLDHAMDELLLAVSAAVAAQRGRVTEMFLAQFAQQFVPVPRSIVWGPNADEPDGEGAGRPTGLDLRGRTRQIGVLGGDHPISLRSRLRVMSWGEMFAQLATFGSA
jgi:hypothetical protein